MVIAGAGSGKTLTIMAKIKYLIEKGYKENEILVISFTKETCQNLRRKLNNEVLVYTFHKLGLEIINSNNKKYSICVQDLLENIIKEFIYNDSLTNKIKRAILYLINEKNIFKYQKIIQENEYKVNILIKQLKTFINLYKNQGYDVKEFIKIHKKIKLNIFTYLYNHYFLLVALNIYIIYEKYLEENHEIDFSDMINLAILKIKNNQFNINFKYVIVDEYQDTSYIRFLLIKELVLKSDAFLLVVGDDFQSIYRFTGCDLNVFLNFKSMFKDAQILKINTTYRTSDELIKIAGSFVMKNKKQIVKTLRSNKNLNNSINIVYFKNYETILKNVVEKIYNQCKSSILILGRNNNDIYKFLGKYFEFKDNKVIFLKNKNIEITYLTVHSSKGLEDDNVIIINMEDDILGFPSKIKDKNIFKYVLPKIDNYKYSEERRLFYVALTRTKNKVYLLTLKNRESIFIKELKKYKNVNIIKYD